MERNDPPGASRAGEDVTNEGGHYSSEKEVEQQAIYYSRGRDKFDAYPEQRSALASRPSPRPCCRTGQRRKG